MKITSKSTTSKAENQKDTIDLRDEWKQLYRIELPSLAKARSPSQPHWPVHLDHCFARIILDAVVGDGRQPWTEVIGKPAVEKMTDEQLKRCILLARSIADGDEDLVALDQQSLKARGKNDKAHAKTQARGSKRKPEQDAAQTASNKRKSHPENPSRSPPKNGSLEQDGDDGPTAEAVDESPRKVGPSEKRSRDISSYFRISNPSHAGKSPGTAGDTTYHRSAEVDALIDRIANETKLSPLRKLVLGLMLDIPHGRWTTYGSISDYINHSRREGNPRSSGIFERVPVLEKDTCARAVGVAVFPNPYAPSVPCHRVLAAGGRLGGFGGRRDERLSAEKKRLLQEEGVRFDGHGKAMGHAWTFQ